MLGRVRGLALAAVLAFTACESTGPEDAPRNSRENPAPIGQAVEFKASGFLSGDATVRLTLLRTVSGQAALDSVMAANRFNDPPPAGMHYVLARFRVEVVAASGAFELSRVEWETVSGSGVIADAAWSEACCFQADIGGEGFQGATWEGWLPLFVAPSDNGALTVYQRESGNGGAWFRLR